jgi:hypothetical protein
MPAAVQRDRLAPPLCDDVEPRSRPRVPPCWSLKNGRRCAIHHTPTPPDTPPSLRQAVHWIGRLGGLLDRRRDGEPDVTVLWQGFQHLTGLTIMYCMMRPASLSLKNVGKG